MQNVAATTAAVVSHFSFATQLQQLHMGLQRCHQLCSGAGTVSAASRVALPQREAAAQGLVAALPGLMRVSCPALAGSPTFRCSSCRCPS